MEKSWSDLPEDILACIHNILSFQDQIYFRRVCHAWRFLSQDRLSCSDCLPWLVKYKKTQWLSENGDPILSQLFDPLSKKVMKVSKGFMDWRYIYTYSDTVVYASKHGWVLLSHVYPYSHSLWLFLHNPFTGHLISLPELPEFGVKNYVRAATFTMDPPSPDCEILVYTCAAQIARFCLSDEQWSIGLIKLEETEIFCSIEYMKGELYCVSKHGMLASYNLANKSWKFLTSSFSYYEGIYPDVKTWLTWKMDDLLMVTRDLYNEGEWKLFKFNWIEENWVDDTGSVSMALFISDKVVLSAPLKDSNGENIQDIRICYLRCCEKKTEIECYSFKERNWVQFDDYSWKGPHILAHVTFLEPPHMISTQ